MTPNPVRPPCSGGRRGRVGPVVVVPVGERHVARARPVHLPERGQRVVDRVPALDADERRDTAGPVDPHDVVGRRSHLERLGIARRHPLHEVDLLERRLHRLGARQLRRDVHRPELAAHAASLQARDVGVHGRDERRGVGREVDLVEVVLHALRVLLGHVVVPVDERRFAQDPADALGLGARGQSERGRSAALPAAARTRRGLCGHDAHGSARGPDDAAGPVRMRFPATGYGCGCNRVPRRVIIYSMQGSGRLSRR